MSAAPSSFSSREREVFLDALDLPAGPDRIAFLNRACGDDPALRRAVETLLQNHAEDGFLHNPVVQALRSASNTITFEKPGDRIGRYKLLESIGEGGGGTVFMAEQEEPVRRRVALKVVKPGMDTRSVIARFESERQALAMMDHPNIARVLDAGATETGRPYFVMELVRGIRITDYCDENQLTTRERLQLFIKVCHAIQHAHQKGVIHRDIKPSNILVTLHDGVPVPKVIDFGIAKAIDHRLTDHTFFTEFRAFLGTPAYMSPEQAEMSGLDIDTRADIYSLGVVLYEILTGRTPFDARELVASGLDGMRRTIREEDPLRPSTRLRSLADADRTLTARRQQSEPARLVSLLSGDLDWIVLKSLEKDRSRRYETANALALDVQRFLDDDPILARPPSTLYRFGKLARRYRIAFAAASAVAVALFVGLGIATWQFIEKSRAFERISEAEASERHLRQRAQRERAVAEELRSRAQHQERLTQRKAYAADINLAQHALAANNLGRATELLESYLPREGEPDLRHWEWAYLWQNLQSDAIASFCEMSNSVSAVQISSDDRWVAVQSGDRITVWDFRSRKPAVEFDTGASRAELAFSPTSPLLAFSESSGAPFTQRRHRVRLWDPVEHRFAGELPLTAGCRTLAFSPDGRVLLSVSGDGNAETWDVASATRLSRVSLPGPPRPTGFSGLTGPTGNFARASRDLRWLALGGDGGNLRVVDAATGELRWSAKAADEQLIALAFSPDGRLLATGAGFVESAIRIWDVATGKEITRLEGHRTWVSSLVFWPDGQTLASASADQTIRLWDISDVRDLQDSPDSPARRHPGRILQPDAGRSHPHVSLQGHKLEVWSLTLMHDATTLISGSKDGSVYVWDATRRPRDRSRLTLAVPVRAWRFSPDNHSIIAIDTQGRAARWKGDDFQDSEPILDLGSSPFPYLLSPDGRYALVIGFTGAFRVWDLVQGVSLPDWRPAAGNPVFPLEFDASSKHLRTRNPADGTIQEWEIATGRETRSWKGASSRGPGNALAFSNDGSRWLQIVPNGASLLGTPESDSPVSIELGLPQVAQAAFSPDGQRFAIVSGLGQGALWQVSPPAKLASISGFLQGTHAVAFSPDGSRIAIGSDGREAIKLWDVVSHQELITLAGDGSRFRTIEFSPDGRFLGASNSKGVLHIWRASSDVPALPRLAPRP